MGKGRRGDAPGVQEDKGFPSKRKTKVERQIEAAEGFAKLLATAPGLEDDPLAPPAFLDARFAPALAVWKDYAPRLHKLNLLDALDRHTFALFCIWMGEFVTSNEDIQKNGYTRLVKTVSGDKMPRELHAVSRRDTAMKYILELSKRYGLTPLDRYALLRDQSAGALGGLFGGSGSRRSDGDGEGQSAEDDPIGSLDRMDSPPPAPVKH